MRPSAASCLPPRFWAFPAGLTQTYDLIFSNTFTVGQASDVPLGAVPATISVGIGVMLSGSGAAVPITLNSQSELISLSFELPLPTNLFSAISVPATSAVVNTASLSVLSSNTIELSFTAAAGQNLEGSRQIAQLILTAAANESSAMVPLWPQGIQGANAGLDVANVFFAQPGRAVIIGPQPLLDMQLVGGSRNLVLYGIPGQSYQIQSETNLARAGGWSDFARVPMTDLALVLPNLDPPAAAVFFRAYVLNADPPVLQASVSGTNLSLLSFGLAGSNYTLQTSSNLSATAAWRPLLSYTLTNSFQSFTNPGPGSPAFYRLKKQ